MENVKDNLFIYNLSTSVKLLTGTLLLFAISFLFFQQNIFKFSFNLLLGLILAPFIFRKVGARGRLLYFFPALLFFGLLLFGRSSSLYFFGLGFSVLFLLESYWGRLNVLPVFWWFIVSPLFRQFSNIWSFPIRLQLSDWATSSLSFLGFKTYAEGNMIHFQGSEFSVDPACMGLNMIIVSLLLGLFLIGHFEQKGNRSFEIFSVSFILGVIILLCVVANFIRLLALVLFHILPANPMHDLVGLICLVGYVLVPGYFLVRRWGRGDGRRTTDDGRSTSVEGKEDVVNNRDRVHIVMSLILFGFLAFTGRQFLEDRVEQDSAFAKLEIVGFEKSQHSSGVLKLENDNFLVYIKPSLNPLQGSHDPRYCWSGSGYEFKRVQENQVENNKVFTAELINGEDRLYTAWWFDNGQTQTIEEWEWRWKTLRGGEGFRLVNVTAEDPTLLKKELARIIQSGILK